MLNGKKADTFYADCSPRALRSQVSFPGANCDGKPNRMALVKLVGLYGEVNFRQRRMLRENRMLPNSILAKA